MSNYLTGNFVTANQILIDLSPLLTANGWIVDYDGVYSTSYRRIHFHKGTAHFEIYSGSATYLYFYGCTGWSSGSAPTAQPGVSAGSKSQYGTAGYPYYVVVTPRAVFIGLPINSYLTIYWSTMFIVESKIGNWSDGHGLSGAGNSGFMGSSWYGAPTYAQIYCNGAWSPTAVAGGLCGNHYAYDLVAKTPCYYNGAVIPFPIVLFVRDTVDTTKFRPIGYMPDFYKTRAGDLYTTGDTKVIGSDTYIWLPQNNEAVVSNTTGIYGDSLIKIS